MAEINFIVLALESLFAVYLFLWGIERASKRRLEEERFERIKDYIAFDKRLSAIERKRDSHG